MGGRIENWLRAKMPGVDDNVTSTEKGGTQTDDKEP
jgi:hypothetical protein